MTRATRSPTTTVSTVATPGQAHALSIPAASSWNGTLRRIAAPKSKEQLVITTSALITLKVCKSLVVYNTPFHMLYIADGCFEENAAYPENDITKDFPSDLQECQDKCKKKEDCRVFTWTEGVETRREKGVCIYKISKRKTGKVLRDGDKRAGVLRMQPGAPAQRKVSGSVRNEENQHVWCRGKPFFEIHRLTPLFQCWSLL